MHSLLLAACSVGSDEKSDVDDAAAEAYYAAQEDEAEAETQDEGSIDTDLDPGGGESAECPPPDCIQLAEGVDRGLVSISMTSTGAFQIANFGHLPVCLDRWYTFFSPTSQDGIGGVTTSLRVEPGESTHLMYGQWGEDEEAWWCIEEDQYTSVGAEYRFNGADAPDLGQSYGIDEWDLDDDGVLDHEETTFRGVTRTQVNVWDYVDTSPVVVVGRATNYVELATGDRAPIEIEVINLGRLPASARVEETIPSGWYASGFSVEPSAQRVDDATGATTYTFDVTMPAALDPEDRGSATYGVALIGYELSYAGACTGRETGFAPTARWMDASGEGWVSAGADMIVACCEGGGTIGD